MFSKSGARIWTPPMRLRPLTPRAAAIARSFWVVCFVFALIADISATAYVVRDKLKTEPFFASWGLDYNVRYGGPVWIGTYPDQSGKQRLETQSVVVSIEGKGIAPGAKLSTIENELRSISDSDARMLLRTPEGRLINLHIHQAQKPVSGSLNYRFVMRLCVALAAWASLLACSLLLALRKPGDPVAMLFACCFAGMAASIDPPLQMWMYLDLTIIDDVLSLFWFYGLTIALATFPDGVFVPRIFRWLIPLGIPLSVFLSVPDMDGNIQALVGVGTLFSMLAGQAIRYRRLGAGIERQQIKWAGFGFAVGLVLLSAAFILASFVPDNPSERNAFVNLATLVCFSLGMAAFPFGLLIALTRFRLWEADTVITRSAAYAVVTVVVGTVWAASSDLMKMIIEQVIGRESQAGATTVGAIIAAGIFSPTQSLVLGWTRKRFGGPLERIHEAAKRLKNWGLTEPPGEVATRALSIIDQAIHPAASAIVLDTALSRELIAAREVSSADDPRLVEKLTLADEESSVGTLLLGRRSDGNRYNRLELEAVREIIPPLAEALRVARGRYSRESLMQQRLDEMAMRLSQLEGGAPKPA